MHFVDEAFDRGAIIAQWPVPVFADDAVGALAKRVLRVGHVLLPRVVQLVASGLVTLPLIIVAYAQSSGVLLGAGSTAIALGAVAWMAAVWGLWRGSGAVTRARLLGVEGPAL